jgi:hypothetical protein
MQLLAVVIEFNPLLFEFDGDEPIQHLSLPNLIHYMKLPFVEHFLVKTIKYLENH